MAGPTTVDEYLGTLSDERRAGVEQLRQTINAAASEAVIEALGDELTPYLTGKGTIRFPADQPIPVATVAKIVKVRVAENGAHASR